MSGQLVEQWPEKKIEDVLHPIIDFRGRTPKKLGLEWGGGEIHALSALNVKDDGIDFTRTKNFGSEELYSKWMTKGEAALGDVILTTEAPLGKVAQIPDSKKYILSQRVVLLKPKEEILNADFLAWVLRSPDFQKKLQRNETGATVRGIRMALFKNLTIPIPPLKEQQRIVSILDETFNYIKLGKSHIHNNLNMGRDVIKSHLNEFFDCGKGKWKEEKLENLGILTSSKRIYKNEYVEQGIPFYRSKEIKELSHGKKTSVNLFISTERYEEIKKKFDVPKKGDLLLTAVGTIGEMYIVKDDEEFYFKDGNIMWLKNFVSLEPEYLKLALTNFVEQIKSLSKGAAYNALTIQKLKQYSIPIPPLDEQKNMVSQFQKMELQTRELQYNNLKKLECLDELHRSTLQRAFNGTM